MKLVSFGRWTAVLALGWCPAVAQGKLWIVDDGGGAGVDFTALQPAIDAAAGGDTILVHAGTYAASVIDGKALVVAEQPGEYAKVAGLRVQNLQPDQRVVLRGLASDRWALEASAG